MTMEEMVFYSGTNVVKIICTYFHSVLTEITSDDIYCLSPLSSVGYWYGIYNYKKENG